MILVHLSFLSCKHRVISAITHCERSGPMCSVATSAKTAHAFMMNNSQPPNNSRRGVERRQKANARRVRFTPFHTAKR